MCITILLLNGIILANLVLFLVFQTETGTLSESILLRWGRNNTSHILYSKGTNKSLYCNFIITFQQRYMIAILLNQC